MSEPLGFQTKHLTQTNFAILQTCFAHLATCLVTTQQLDLVWDSETQLSIYTSARNIIFWGCTCILRVLIFLLPSETANGMWHCPMCPIPELLICQWWGRGQRTSNERSHLISCCVWCLATNMCPTLAVVSALTPGPPLTMVAMHTPCSHGYTRSIHL